jgi:hypothetical protein
MREVFAPKASFLSHAIEERVLPLFDNIEAESNRLAEEAFQRLGSLAASDYTDMGDLAESAREVGLAHYESMMGLRQGMLNLFAAALHHLLEQQLLAFHRRQVLHPAEEYDQGLFSTKIIRARLGKAGIDITQFKCWPKIEELRLVANTVKHADGDSAERLQQLRHELFVPPVLRETRLGSRKWRRRVEAPILGRDLYVEPSDLDAYAKAVACFWEELATAIEGSP